MRITKEDRQNLDRRLRDRFPAIFRKRGTKRSIPLALCVAVTLSLTPAAYAKVKEKQAEPVLVMKKAVDPNHYEVAYTREQLQMEPPANPSKGLAQRIMEEVNGLLDRMWRQQASGKERTRLDALMTKEPTPETYGLAIAAMKKPPKIKYSDGNAISKQLSRNFQKVFTDATKKRVGLIDHFNAGVGFDLDLSDDLWASKAETPKKPKGKIRYGLVLQDIEVTKRGPNRAALGDDLSDLNYAGHADVTWTIGPLEDQEGQRIFNIQPPRETQPGDSLWHRLRIPEASFSGKVTPVNFDNLADLKGDDSLPGWRIEIRQSEDYYVLTHVTDSQGKKQSEEHTFKVPVVGTLEVGRRFDDKFHVIQTSAYNILIDKRMPLVSVHYMNMEQRLVGSFAAVYDGHTLELSGSSQGSGTAPTGLSKSKRIKYMSERYGLKYSKKF